MNIDVDFYELPDGTEPVREFLNSLDIKMRAKMYREIDLLVINGPELREPHSKHSHIGFCTYENIDIRQVFLSKAL